MAAILIATVEEQRLGLRVEDVREVLWAVAVTPLPGSPEMVEGIISVRGETVPVVDLRPRFGKPRRAGRLSDRFVIVQAEGRSLALRFDSAEGVVEVGEESIGASASFGPPARGIVGVVKLADGLLLIHEMSSFLSATEAALLEAALAGQEGGAAE